MKKNRPVAAGIELTFPLTRIVTPALFWVAVSASPVVILSQSSTPSNRTTVFPETVSLVGRDAGVVCVVDEVPTTDDHSVETAAPLANPDKSSERNQNSRLAMSVRDAIYEILTRVTSALTATDADVPDVVDTGLMPEYGRYWVIVLDVPKFKVTFTSAGVKSVSFT